MADESKSGSRFMVDLGDIKLSRLVEKQVEADIKAVVLRALAESDFIGNRRGQRDPDSIPIWEKFPGGTLGLWIGDQLPIGFPGGFPGDTGPLTVRDHTLIVNTVMEHPMQVLRNLPEKHKTRGGRPSGREVLQAALQVEQIDDFVKGRMRAVLDLLPKIEEGQANLPESVKRAAEDLRQQLTNKSVDEQRRVLRDPDLRSRHRDDGFAEGMEVAARILDDGRDSIYSPDHSFYKLLQQGAPRAAARDSLEDTANADTVGAAVGGGVGLVVGGVGAGPGAVAGGAGASLGFVLGTAIGWLFD
ncbi:hypothetical protein SAMN05216386_1695 [Nitrosospira briensis]|uniref:Uncharacterized protein n=1 Tax=Nitrosospira briensis TaxID=35799 RepID=A0A1I5BJG3_9PROT|nr:hypothetical protein [Nitrosospira briensis]SFN74786.1 hypothetical protein SAMN05216386_1695 [Nitrosospira briensis]